MNVLPARDQIMNELPQAQEKKKVVEPTFHFISQKLKIGDDYTTATIPVTELVGADQLLADFPDFHQFDPRNSVKAGLEPGENAHLSEDEESILASVPGYPKVTKIGHPDSPSYRIEISVEPLVLVSEDGMSASIAIHPPLEYGNSLRDKNIERLITEQGIVFGLKSEAIASVCKQIASKENEFKKIVVASGKPVGESSDASLRFEMEIGPIAGKIMADGTIDFRDRKIMVGVNEGQLIATKIPAVQGEPGINVYGQETAAREPRDVKIELLNDARYNPETLQVNATRNGVLSVVNENVIKVCSNQIIGSDVDYQTGNIESKNCVTVQGSVQPGFHINAGGDVMIIESIMSASVTCQGNLVVKGGITGKNSEIKTSGDADINFIEQGQLLAGGLVVVRKQSYYSDICAGGDIRCHKTSRIIGGRIIAEGCIGLGELGSTDSRPSLLAAGVVADRLDRLSELKSSVLEQQETIIQWLQQYRGNPHSKKIRKMEEKLAETKLLLLRVNLIPGTGIYSRVAGPADQVQLSGDDYRSDGGIDIEKITIDVTGTIYADTVIRIGNCSMKLEKTVSNRRFKLHRNKKRIISVPLKT